MNLIKKYNSIIFITYSVLILVIFACNDVKSHRQRTQNNKYQIIKEIPTYDDLTYDLFYDYKNVIVRKLNLDTLEFGFDTLAIRVWYFYTSKKECQMFEFYKYDNKWEGVYNLISNNTGIEDTAYKYSIKSKNVNPKTNWGNFEFSIINNKVATLPDDQVLEKYNLVSDGDLVSIEIATNKLYRFYSYNEPFYNKNIPEARFVVNFMKSIEKEFRIKKLRNF